MSQLLDREVIAHHALVVEANPTSRSVLLQHPRSFGFQRVKQASRIIDARDILEHRRYDVVVCDYHFDNGGESGQDLLDELRREQMLALLHRLVDGHRRSHLRQSGGSRRVRVGQLPGEVLFSQHAVRTGQGSPATQARAEGHLRGQGGTRFRTRGAHRYCAPATHIAGVRRSNRSAGGLVLRR